MPYDPERLRERLKGERTESPTAGAPSAGLTKAASAPELATSHRTLRDMARSGLEKIDPKGSMYHPGVREEPPAEKAAPTGAPSYVPVRGQMARGPTTLTESREPSGVTYGARSFVHGMAELPASMLHATAVGAKHLPFGLEERRPLEELATERAARGIRSIVQRALPVPPEAAEGYLTGKLPRALGQGVGFVAGGLASKAPYMFPAITGGALGASGAYDRAKSEGATEDEAFTAYLGGFGLGLTEAVPVGNLLNRINRGTGGAFKRALIESGRQGLEEAIQEAVQTVGERVMLNAILDKKGGIKADLIESQKVAGPSGAILGFVTNLVLGRRGRMPQTVERAPVEPVPERVTAEQVEGVQAPLPQFRPEPEVEGVLAKPTPERPLKGLPAEAVAPKPKKAAPPAVISPTPEQIAATTGDIRVTSEFRNAVGDIEQYGFDLFRGKKLIGQGSYAIGPDGVAKIGKVSAFKGAGSIGIRGIRKAREDLIQQNPNIKSFVGDRVSGAWAMKAAPPVEKAPWQMTRKQYLTRKPFPQSGRLDPKNPPKQIENAAISAVKMDDGTIYFDTEASIHAQLIANLQLPVNRIKVGGFLINGRFVPGGSGAAALATKVGARERVKHARAVREAVEKGEAVPKEVLKDYPDLQKKKLPARVAVEFPEGAMSVEEARDLIGAFKEGDTVQNAVLKEMKKMISEGTPGTRVKIDTGEVRGLSSTFPKWFQNKGYAKKESLRILENVIAGKTVTERQAEMVSDLVDGMIKQVQEEARAQGYLSPEEIKAEERAAIQEEAEGEPEPSPAPEIPAEVRPPREAARPPETPPAPLRQIPAKETVRKPAPAAEVAPAPKPKTPSAKPAAAKEPWEMTREEYNRRERIVFHQTSKKAAKKIELEGFRLDLPQARRGDDVMPDAVFFKIGKEDIGVGGVGNKARQLEAQLLTKDIKIKDFQTTSDLKRFLNKDPEYSRLVGESRLDDIEKAKQIDALGDKYLTVPRKQLSRKMRTNFDRELEALKESTYEAPTKARARATAYLKEQGIGAIFVREDPGFMGRKTSTFAILDPKRIVISPHRKIVEKALSEGKSVPQEVLKDYPELGKKPAVVQKPGQRGVGVVKNRPSVRVIQVGENDARKVRFNDQEEQRLYDIGSAAAKVRAGIGGDSDTQITKRAEGLGILEDADKAFARVRGRARAIGVRVAQPKNLEAAEKEADVQYSFPTKPNYRLPPPGSAQASEVRGRYRIIEDLERKLNAPIRYGKVRGARATGLFKTKPEVIRLKAAQDVPIAAHEVGHWIEKHVFRNRLTKPTQLKGEAKEILRQFRTDLMDVAQTHQKPSIAEGWAEFFRHYVVSPEWLQQNKPKLLASIDGLLSDHYPEIREAMIVARNDYARWIKAPASARIMSEISFDAKNDRAYDFHKFYTDTFDDLHPIKVIEDAMLKGKKIHPSESPYILHRVLRGWRGKADAFLERGTFDFQGLKPSGKSLEEVLAPIWKRRHDFSIYAVAKRAEELRKRGVRVPWDRATTQKALSENASSAFEKAFRDLQTYNDALLKYLKDSGGMSDDQLAAIKALNQNYVPFFRLVEGKEGRGSGAGQTTANLFAPVKRIKGSMRPLIDPMESIFKNTFTIINWAERNYAAQSLIRMGEKNEGLGKFIEKVPRAQAPTQVQVKDVIKKAGLSEYIPDLSEIEGSTVTIFKPSLFESEANTITIWENGKRSTYRVHPELYRAMMSLDREAAGGWARLLRFPAKTLRAGATLTWSFAMRNPARDQVSAFLNSKYGYIPGVDLLRGLYHYIGKTDLYWDSKISGAAYSALVSMDRTYLRRGVKELMHTRAGKVANLIKNPIEMLRALSEAGEMATRIGEFAKGRKAEGPGRRGGVAAAYSARELTLDFQRVGAKQVAINQIAAFWNAGLQGIDRPIRGAKDAPAAYTARIIAGITLPSIIFYLLNRGEDWYDELPQWERDIYWHFKAGGKIWRIPKPFELGVIFGSLPERMMKFIDKGDPHAFDGLLDSVYRALPGEWVPVFGGENDWLRLPVPIPTALTPLLENYMNYSMFFGRPIVPRSEQELAVEYQYGPYTSEAAKAIGRALKVSPRKIDNIVSGYTGGLGKTALRVAETVIPGMQKPARPARGFAETVFPGFVSRYPTSGSEPIEQFYQEYIKAREEKRTINLLKKSERSEELYQYASKRTSVKDRYDYLGRVAEQLKAMRDRSRKIIDSKTLSGKDKRELLDEISLLMTSTAKQAVANVRARPRKEPPQKVPELRARRESAPKALPTRAP